MWPSGGRLAMAPYPADEDDEVKKYLQPIDLSCRYDRRVLRNGRWTCPPGTRDTGRTWGDQHGDKQCLVGCPQQWNRATATYYNSYPRCCVDPRADQRECRKNNGCAYQGKFAAFGDSVRLPKSWVERNNIIAFYQAPNATNREVWATRWKNRRMRLRNPKTGATMEVRVLDTCDDDDCGNCCSTNANKNGGFLVDLEFNTAKRFYGTDTPPGLQPIEWQLV